MKIIIFRDADWSSFRGSPESSPQPVALYESAVIPHKGDEVCVQEECFTVKQTVIDYERDLVEVIIPYNPYLKCNKELLSRI